MYEAARHCENRMFARLSRKNSFVYRRRSECSPPHKYINRLLIKEKKNRGSEFHGLMCANTAEATGCLKWPWIRNSGMYL